MAAKKTSASKEPLCKTDVVTRFAAATEMPVRDARSVLAALEYENTEGDPLWTIDCY